MTILSVLTTNLIVILWFILIKAQLVLLCLPDKIKLINIKILYYNIVILCGMSSIRAKLLVTFTRRNQNIYSSHTRMHVIKTVICGL